MTTRPGGSPRGSTAGLLELATTMAVAAGRLLLGQGGRPEVVATKSSPTDVVTEADRAAEALIRGLIGEARPGDRILGEEGGETGGAGSGEGEGGGGAGGAGGDPRHGPPVRRDGHRAGVRAVQRTAAASAR